MKRFLCIVLSAILVFSLCSCGKSKLTPMEKLSEYIVENGAQDDGKNVLECSDAKAMIENSDFSIAAMKNLKGSGKYEFKIIKDDSDVILDLVDSSIVDGGMKMERHITINLDGKYTFRNSLIMNGNDLGVYLEGEIPVDTYNKENDPVITKSELASGAKLTDSVKATLKDYINLAFDCFVNELSKEELGLTIADFGFTAYPVEK